MARNKEGGGGTALVIRKFLAPTLELGDKPKVIPTQKYSVMNGFLLKLFHLQTFLFTTRVSSQNKAANLAKSAESDQVD